MFIKINQPLLKAIQRVLMDQWDPIGVRGDADAADEYDSYANRVYAYLASGWNAEQVAAYLAQAERDAMQMPPRPTADLLPCAEQLVQAWRQTNSS